MGAWCVRGVSPLSWPPSTTHDAPMTQVYAYTCLYYVQYSTVHQSNEDRTLVNRISREDFTLAQLTFHSTIPVVV